MFTGIIESWGEVTSVREKGSGKTLRIDSPLSPELKTDQSLSHNGVCLTVEEVDKKGYEVTVVLETLEKTNFQQLKVGDRLNLERSLQLNGRLDGHMVQGHVDTTGECIERREMNGSWEFRFRFPQPFASLVIEKGSISIDGISLTVFSVSKNQFSVAIIPYTFEHTNMRFLTQGNMVNLEFDILGKYIQRRLDLQSPDQ